MDAVTKAKVAGHTDRADAALAQLRRARNDRERLAAAQALESAACQLRRALKKAVV